jgi:secreted PhoX family phosphatase
MIDLSRRNLLAGAAVIGTASAFGSMPIARAAAPAAGKQNAGWYRYKVGDFEVTVVTDGMNTNPLSDAYVSSGDIVRAQP